MRSIMWNCSRRPTMLSPVPPPLTVTHLKVRTSPAARFRCRQSRFRCTMLWGASLSLFPHNARTSTQLEAVIWSAIAISALSSRDSLRNQEKQRIDSEGLRTRQINGELHITRMVRSSRVIYRFQLAREQKILPCGEGILARQNTRPTVVSGLLKWGRLYVAP